MSRPLSVSETSTRAQQATLDMRRKADRVFIQIVFRVQDHSSEYLFLCLTAAVRPVETVLAFLAFASRRWRPLGGACRRGLWLLPSSEGVYGIGTTPLGRFRCVEYEWHC